MSERSERTKRVIDRLMEGARAVQCAVTLVGGTVTIHGALSLDPEIGGLRMLSPAPTATTNPERRGGEVSMMEHFFQYDDVMVVSVSCTVTVESPLIVTA